MSIAKGIKEKAIALRLSGKSYTEIQRELGLASKGTLSVWFRELVLPPASRKLLQKNIARATERGLLAFNLERRQRIQMENAQAEVQAAAAVDKLSKRELMLVGATLYWGEGTKYVGKNQTPRLVFTNSDPGMLRLYMRFLREILEVPEEKLSGELHLYEHIDHADAKKYWSSITGIAPERFWSTNAVSRASRSKRPRNRLRYGTAAVRVPSRILYHRVKGMMQRLADEGMAVQSAKC